MRKLLLASAAMLGATSGIASAQAPVPAAANMMMQPSQGQFALPYASGPAANNNNNAYGQPSTYLGGAAFGKNAVPTPGTVVIRLNGRVEVDMNLQYSTNNTSATPGFKVNPVTFGAYMRLYPGVDGMATNGLRYGASVELRENFSSTGNAAQATPTLGSASGAASATSAALGGAAPGPSGYNSSQTVFVRRSFAYLAADNVGVFRFGVTDGLISLFDPCIFNGGCYDAGIGNINGGQAQTNGANGAFAIPFVWLAQAGAEYSNVKAVYLSPQFFGLDFGVQYAPSMGNGFSTCNAAAFNCNATVTGNDPTRWYNQVAVGARYQGAFGPVKLGVYGVYETAAKESYFGPASASGRGFNGTRYDNLSFVSAATYLTVDTPAGQFTGSFDYIGGALNGQLAMRPSGGVPERGFLAGLTYRNGPITLGGQAGLVQSQGAQQLTAISQRREVELAVGGTYTVAPGLFLVGEYMYTYRHQGGYDFNTGGAGRRGDRRRRDRDVASGPDPRRAGAGLPVRHRGDLVGPRDRTDGGRGGGRPPPFPRTGPFRRRVLSLGVGPGPE